MTIALILFFMVAAVVSQVFLFLQLKKIRETQQAMLDFHRTLQPVPGEAKKNFDRLCLKLDEITRHFNKSISVLQSTFQTPSEPIKPIKPNNWDSMKEAFKGPQRAEYNE